MPRGESITQNYRAVSAVTGQPISGDQANHTLKITADGVQVSPAHSPASLGSGEYSLVLNAGENDGEFMSITGTSSTGSVLVIPARWRNETGPAVVTFSQAAAGIGAAAPEAGTISILRGDTISQQLTDLGSLVGRTKLYFTAKSSVDKADAKSTIHVEESAGLLFLGGKVPSSSSLASIVVDDANAGDVTLHMTATATALLVPGEYTYDVEVIVGATVVTLAEGTLVVTADVTRKTS